MKSSGFVLHKLVLSLFVISDSISFKIVVAFLQPFVALVLSNVNMVAISFAVLGQSFVLHDMYIDAAMIPSLFNPLNVLCSEIFL